MKGVGLLIILLAAAALATPALIAAEQPDERSEDSKKADDVQDLILLSPTHPVRIRMHIVVSGVGFREAWRKSVDGAFDRMDTAKSGRISAEQAERLVALFRNAGASPSVALPATPAVMTKLMPHELTRDEVRSQVAQVAPQFAVRNRLSSGGAGPAIFTLLDSDGDGRLSRDELNAAQQSLRCRDFDDDGLLTSQELVQGPAPSKNDPSESTAAAGPVITVDEATPAAAIAETLLYRYDRNRDGRLTYSGTGVEIRSGAESLAKIDADHDGALDRIELTAWLNSPPDVELTFQLGQASTGSHSVTRQPSEQPGVDRLRRKLDGGYRLTAGTNDFDFRRNNRDPAQASQPPRLADYDTDGDGQLNADELKTAGFADALSLIDTDGDGKVSREEFEAYFQWRSSTMSIRLVLEATDEGQDLFSLLDRNGDGILSPREQKMAALLLDTEDANHDNYLSSDEIPYRMVLELSRGGSSPPANAPEARVRNPSPRRAKPDPSAPAWFQKMDRNGDGELSLEEFLGSREQFDKLDSNHDGLIDATEAATAKPGGTNRSPEQ